MRAARGGWKSSLKGDPAGWLLGADNPVVRYWALRDFEGAPRAEVEAARQEAVGGDVVEEVFRQQRRAGHWERPGNMHAPHYTATIYQLSLLGDLGLTADDERIRKGVEVALGTQKEDGGFAGHNPTRCAFGPYDIGLIVRFMHQFGLGSDPRVKRMYRWIEKHQTPSGGWAGAGYPRGTPTGGCLNASANVLWGLAARGGCAGKQVARRGIGFLANVMALEPDCGRRLSYPQFWNFWVDDVKLAEILLGLGASAAGEPLKGCVERVLSQQGTDGRWSEGAGPYPEERATCRQLRALFPKMGEPSKWVTAKAMIALKQALA